MSLVMRAPDLDYSTLKKDSWIDTDRLEEILGTDRSHRLFSLRVAGLCEKIRLGFREEMG